MSTTKLIILTSDEDFDSLLIVAWQCLSLSLFVTVTLLPYIMSHTKICQFLSKPREINCVTVLLYNDSFCHRHRITSSMKNIIATPGLPWLPSLPHHQWSTHLVQSDLAYFTRNCTISTMHFLLHGSYHDWKQQWWEICKCKLLFIVIILWFIPLHHWLIDTFIAVNFLAILGGLAISQNYASL